MVDVVSVAKRSEMMAGIRGKNTRPEMLIRKLLHAAGYRYRLHVAELPGKPDLVFPRHKVVIFVHGCFWHGHENCALFRLPKSREEFWAKKIGSNVARDQTQELKLLELGWRIVTLWECALKGKYRLAEPVLLEQLNGFFQGADHILDISGTSPEILFRLQASSHSQDK